MDRGGVQTTPVHLTQTNNKNDKIKINGQLYIFLRIVFFQMCHEKDELIFLNFIFAFLQISLLNKIIKKHVCNFLGFKINSFFLFSQIFQPGKVESKIGFYKI